MDRVHLLQDSWTEHLPTTLPAEMPLSEAISRPLGLWHSLPGPLNAFLTLVWLQELKSLTYVDALLPLLMLWNPALGRPPVQKPFIASLASHSPPAELTLGRPPAPILGCQPCSRSLACLPLSWSCVDVTVFGPLCWLGLTLFIKGRKRSKRKRFAFFSFLHMFSMFHSQVEVSEYFQEIEQQNLLLYSCKLIALI